MSPATIGRCGRCWPAPVGVALAAGDAGVAGGVPAAGAGAGSAVLLITGGAPLNTAVVAIARGRSAAADSLRSEPSTGSEQKELIAPAEPQYPQLTPW